MITYHIILVATELTMTLEDIHRGTKKGPKMEIESTSPPHTYYTVSTTKFLLHVPSALPSAKKRSWCASRAIDLPHMCKTLAGAELSWIMNPNRGIRVDKPDRTECEAHMSDF